MDISDNEVNRKMETMTKTRTTTKTMGTDKTRKGVAIATRMKK